MQYKEQMLKLATGMYAWASNQQPATMRQFKPHAEAYAADPEGYKASLSLVIWDADGKVINRRKPTPSTLIDRPSQAGRCRDTL